MLTILLFGYPPDVSQKQNLRYRCMRITLAAVLICFATLAEARLPDLIPYRKGNLWGYCDSTKKIIIEPAWDRADVFGKTTAVVQKNGRFGIIDRTGKVIIQPLYYWIESEEHHGLREIMLTTYGDHGAINAAGVFVIPMQYEWLTWRGPFLEGMKGRGKCGVFDSLGRIVVPFIYRNRGDFPESMGDSGQFAMCRNGKWGVVDTAGKIVIPFSYYWVTSTDCGKWEARTDYFTSMYFDTKGNYLGDTLKCQSVLKDWSYHQLKNGMQSFVGDDKLIGFRNTSGRIIYEAQFLTAYDFEPNGLAFVGFRTGDCETCFGKGYIDSYGTKYWEE